MLGTMDNYPLKGIFLRLRFADDHALDDRRRLESLAQRHGTGTPFIRDLGRVWRRPVPQ